MGNGQITRIGLPLRLELEGCWHSAGLYMEPPEKFLPGVYPPTPCRSVHVNACARSASFHARQNRASPRSIRESVVGPSRPALTRSSLASETRLVERESDRDVFPVGCSWFVLDGPRVHRSDGANEGLHRL